MQCRMVKAAIVLLLPMLFSCSENNVEPELEILVYCGITMIRPVSEIAQLVERQKKCRIIITKGGSGNLLSSILTNRIGDVYLPGSERYYQTIDRHYKGLILYRKKVGDNHAVLMVQKGNPKNIDVSLAALADPRYSVVIGSPVSGSIGKETKKILDKQGIYNNVVENVIFMTTDSKDLVKAIREKEADIVVNWFAALTWDDNSDYIDVFELNNGENSNNELIMGILNTTLNYDIAKYFVDFCASEQGAKIFRKHGL